MKILVNGEPKEVQPSLATLKDLLDSLSINHHTVAVERNEVVVRRAELETTRLEDGDKIEIVRFVGGGLDAETPEPAAKPAKKRRRKSSEPVSKARHLVIVESPAKAKTINKYLGDDYHVEASLGHVRDLPKSKMGVDIDQNFEPNYIVIKRAMKTVKNLKKQAKGKETVYLAPDPDREGEAISWHLAHIFREEENGQAAIKRVVFNEITKDAIKEAFKHPRDIEMNLVNAQQARRILDRIVGYELSPLLWRKVGKGLSAGRVQSVALRLIVEREREIQKFVPQEYWSLEAKLASQKEEDREKTFIAKLDKINGEKAELKDRETTQKIREEVLTLPFRIQKADKQERRRKPQAPFTTSKLQQEAYTRLGFPAAKTMKIAQKLYEGVEIGQEGSVGLITYMRTDSVNISVGAQKECIEFILKKFGEKFLPEKPPVYRSKKGAQEAHEAIRPTGVIREPETMKPYLDEDEFKLYDLIWKKFVSSQMTQALDEHTALTISAGEKYQFRATGRRNLFPGFLILYSEAPAEKGKQDDKSEDNEDEKDAELPILNEGDPLNLCELLGLQHFTKPPARFNDASLVKTLEENGIGRPSTYAPTIYTLLAREYVNRKGGAIIPTELGEIVVDLLVQFFPTILNVEFTATMEEELDKIEEGGREWKFVLKEFYAPFKDRLSNALEQMKNFRRETVPTEYTCDICGKHLVMRWGRFGKFLACSGFPDCKYTRSIPTGFRCPQPDCGGDIVKRKSKNRRTFYGCSNYPKCNYITNKLPKQEEGMTDDEKLSESDREVLGP